ncbi:MAG: phage-related baseplate assembly protein [Rickettsiales bacterium]|jgi:phage-related baseplate assembly protein
MKNFTAIDLSKLPAPNVIEKLDYETILAEYIADFKAKNPEYETFLESDPAIILMQTVAYRELLLRNRINEAAKANMLAYAQGSDLENLSAFYGVQRDEDEDDDRLRTRTQLALEGFSTAGPVGAYIFHALSADPKVKSVSVDSPDPGKVLVTILSIQGDGTVLEPLRKIVEDKLGEDDIRPLTDFVTVAGASIVNYQVDAVITVYPGPSSAVVENEARSALEKFVADRHEIGRVVPLSGIYDALHIDGVKKVELISPIADIITTDYEAPYATNINITLEIAQ